MEGYLTLRIKDERKKLSLTQPEFGNMLGVTKSVIGSYEEGRATPPLDTLVKMSTLFGMSLDELITGERVENKKIVDLLNWLKSELKVESQNKMDKWPDMAKILLLKRIITVIEK